MPKVSAGLLMVTPAKQFLLVHPGGPFFAKKDAGAWSIPKGLIEPGEDLLRAAIREFEEETGWSIGAPSNAAHRGAYDVLSSDSGSEVHSKGERFVHLGSVEQKGGKVVHAWAFVDDRDPATIRSNEFELEWPPRSGKHQRFPEVDRGETFSLEDAGRKILPAQLPFLERAVERVPLFDE